MSLQYKEHPAEYGIPLEKLGYPIGSVAMLPPGEDLFRAGTQEGATTMDILSDPRLIEQSRIRRALFSNLEELYAQVHNPNLEWSTALREGTLTSQQIEKLYEQLTEFLVADPNNCRLILYLPLEILIPREELDSLSDIGGKFCEIYLQNWIAALTERDIRANFIDGDIPDGVDENEIPWVHKAAHLIPSLMQKGWITYELLREVIALNDDKGLEDDISDALTVTARQGLLTPHEIADLRKLMHFLHSSVEQFALSAGKNEKKEQSDQTVQEIIEATMREIAVHEERYASGSPYMAGLTAERLKWEHYDGTERIITAGSIKLVSIFLSDFQALATWGQSILRDEGGTPYVYRLYIQTLFQVIEETVVEDPAEAVLRADQHRPYWEKLWDREDNDLKRDVMRGLQHCVQWGVFPREYLREFGSDIPVMTAALPLSLEDFVTSRMHGVDKALEHIRDQEGRSRFLPVFVISGSVVKGYATVGSDVDVIAFEAIDKRGDDHDRQTPDSFLSGESTPHSYCVATRGEELHIVNPPDDSREHFTPRNIQSLLGSVWMGEKEVVEELRASVLRDYLDLSRFEGKEEIRRQYLRLLEIDTLQARLMHRGFRFFYPDRIPEDVANEETLDGKSAFWDPAYRRIASLLFLRKVFLPDLSK